MFSELSTLELVSIISATTILALFAILAMFRLYHYLTCGRFCQYEKSNMKGKVVIVTGANSGIGKATTRALAGLGARVKS